MLPIEEINKRVANIQKQLVAQNIDAMLISSNVNILYLFGEVYLGLCFIPKQGDVQFLIRKPQTIKENTNIHHIRKIEQLSEIVDISHFSTIALELDELTYNEVQRQRNIFQNIEIKNATSILRYVRMVKTELEIEDIRQTANKHMAVYKEIPSLYKEGMTDLAFQIEVERKMRQLGSVGIFRTFGGAMEIFMGSLISGDNAGAASPYDFAMGGAGNDALPLGSHNVPMSEGNAVMIDMAGNYGVYLSDMTRTFSIGRLTEEAYKLHELSRRMHREIMQTAKPGDRCGSIYDKCIQMAQEHHATSYFMGTVQQAQFVGHGLGLQINEMPVLTSRSKDTLQTNMVIAFEPKFVLPKIGAVGVENTYLITEDGVENLTPLTEEIIDLRTGLVL